MMYYSQEVEALLIWSLVWAVVINASACSASAHIALSVKVLIEIALIGNSVVNRCLATKATEWQRHLLVDGWVLGDEVYYRC